MVWLPSMVPKMRFPDGTTTIQRYMTALASQSRCTKAALYDNGVTFHTCTDMHDIYHKFDDVNMWILEISF